MTLGVVSFFKDFLSHEGGVECSWEAGIDCCVQDRLGDFISTNSYIKCCTNVDLQLWFTSTQGSKDSESYKLA